MKRKTDCTIDDFLVNMSSLRCMDGEEEYELLLQAFEHDTESGDDIEEVLRIADGRYRRYYNNINMEEMPLLEAGISKYNKTNDKNAKYKLMKQIDWYIIAYLMEQDTERRDERTSKKRRA